MSFFLRGKPRRGTKRKFNNERTRGKKDNGIPDRDGDGDEEIDSDQEIRPVPDREPSSDEEETAQEKKVRLARLYLEEVKRREAEERDDEGEEDHRKIGRILRDDAERAKGLAGALRLKLADKIDPEAVTDVTILKCKEQRLPITCACLTGDGEILFTGSKCATIVRWNVAEKRKIAVLKYDGNDRTKSHRSAVLALAVTHDGNWLVSSEARSKDIHVRNGRTLVHYKSLSGHRAQVTGLAFLGDSLTLYSCSEDRSVKVWSLQEMAYVESMFGHQSGVAAIAVGTKERPVTVGGRDGTARLWKVTEETQLVLNAAAGVSLDCVRMIDDDHFATGADDGSVSIWSSARKKPLCTAPAAHGSEGGVPRWICAVAAARNSDLVASGSHDGLVKLWRVADGHRKLEPLLDIPAVGFVNSLLFSSKGDSLLAMVGREHRSGRWSKDAEAKNCILIIPLTKR